MEVFGALLAVGVEPGAGELFFFGARSGGRSPTARLSGPNSADRNPWLIRPAWLPAMFMAMYGGRESDGLRSLASSWQTTAPIAGTSFARARLSGWPDWT